MMSLARALLIGGAALWAGFDGHRVAAQPATVPAAQQQTARWPMFRGPAAGVVTDPAAPAEWDGASGKNILWKVAVPLAGNNAPVIWGDALFLSGATEGQQVVFCFDATTGTLRWQKEVGAPDEDAPPKVMEDTGLAPSTVATDGTHVFAIFPTGDLAALDFAGNLVWSKRLGPLQSQYGYASSLAIWQDRLIIQLDQGLEAEAGLSAIVAFDCATGNEIWRQARPVANSWSSPIALETPTGAQVITAANPWVIAYDAHSGTERWRAKCVYGDVAPSPAYANGTAFVAMENAEAHAIRTDGAGDVTSTHVLWHVDEALPDIVSPVATEQFVYFATTHGTVTCLDAKTGEKAWEHEFDGSFCASPLVINGIVHLVQRDGLTHRFRASGTYEPINSASLGEPVFATPAVADGRIFIRGATHLFCIGGR